RGSPPPARSLLPLHDALPIFAYFEIRLSGPFQDLHSGGYGGAIANPATVLVEMLASLHDERGRITIPGFYDQVRPLTDADRAARSEEHTSGLQSHWKLVCRLL